LAASDTLTELDAIAAIEDRWMHANNRISMDLMREVWTEDPEAVLYSGTLHTYRGVEEWAKKWHVYEKTFSVEKVDVDDRRITVSGDMAYASYVVTVHLRQFDERGSLCDAFEMEQDNTVPVPFRGTDVLMKDGAGEWKLVHCHYSPVPPPDEERPGFGSAAA
jgi:ketosteroid isomerase-like protein